MYQHLLIRHQYRVRGLNKQPFLTNNSLQNINNKYSDMPNQEFIQDFLKFKAELQSFIFRMLTNRQDTEDIVQETYIKVQQNIATFKGESSFKTWVFSIALNLSKNQLAKQKRWLENTQDYGAALHMQSAEHWTSFKNVFESTPEKQYEIKEHLVYCFNCMNKTLELEQQICLLLKEVYDFKVKEIIEITQLSEGKVKHAIADARNILTNIFEKRCAIVNQNGVCNQCSELTGILNPKQNAQVEVNQLKLSKQKNNENREKLLNIRLEMVKSLDPLNANNSLVTTYFLENAEKWVEIGKLKKVLENPSETES